MTPPDPSPSDQPPLPDDAEAPGELDGPEAGSTVPALKSTSGESVGAAVGSFMSGLEQQIFQRRPPAVELVRQAQPVRAVSGDGLEITISVPDASPADPDRKR